MKTREFVGNIRNLRSRPPTNLPACTRSKTIDDVHASCNNVAMSLLLAVVEEAIRDVVAHSIYDVNVTEFETYFSSFFSWDTDFAVIDEKYLAIAASAFTHITARMFAKSLSEPSTPEASAASLPPRLLQLLPVGTKITGRDSHPLENSVLARRTKHSG